MNDYEISEMHGGAGYLFKSKNTNTIENIDFLYNYSGYVGGRYFVLKTPFNDRANNILIKQILLDYIIIFILGNVVRYHQDLWNKSILGMDNGVISLINLYIDIVMRRFPNMILNYIFRENFEYGTPARFM